jgi:hypothetical protein
MEWIYRSTFCWPRQQLEVSGQLHVPAALPPGKEPLVTVGWVGPRAGLDDMEVNIFYTTRTRTPAPRSSDVLKLSARYSCDLQNTFCYHSYYQNELSRRIPGVRCITDILDVEAAIKVILLAAFFLLATCLAYSTLKMEAMEPEGSLPHSQELSSYPYPQPDQYSPHRPIHIPPLRYCIQGIRPIWNHLERAIKEKYKAG